jgi:hypothetical protein
MRISWLPFWKGLRKERSRYKRFSGFLHWGSPISGGPCSVLLVNLRGRINADSNYHKLSWMQLPRFTWWMRSKKVLKSGHISHFSIAILNTDFFSDFFRRCWNELCVFPYQDLYVDKSQYCTTHSCNRKMQLHCQTTCFHYWRPPVWTDQQNSLPSLSLFHWSRQRPRITQFTWVQKNSASEW